MAKSLQFSPPPPPNLGIPIFQKTYDFYKELYLSTIGFPKKHKYTLGQKLDQTLLDFLELLFLASQKQIEKATLLEKASSKLETLKILVRLAKDTASLDNKKYFQLESLLQEIGKMLGGWLKHAKQITLI